MPFIIGKSGKIEKIDDFCKIFFTKPPLYVIIIIPLCGRLWPKSKN